jgi:hypothetical protein
LLLKASYWALSLLGEFCTFHSVQIIRWGLANEGKIPASARSALVKMSETTAAISEQSGGRRLSAKNSRDLG